MSSNAKSIFDKNVNSLNNMGALYDFLKTNAKNIDNSMILRSQFVLIVSAFDTYVHTFLVDTIVEKFFSKECTICDVNVSLTVMHKINCEVEDYLRKQMLMNELNEIFSKDSFQAPKSIEYAYSILGYKKIWQALGDKLGKRGQDVKDTLALLVKRRNKIAHESDINKVTGEYEEIEIETIVECKNFLCELVQALDNLYNK